MTPFKTIQLGQKIEVNKDRMSIYAQDIASKITPQKEIESVDLVKISVKDLGLPNGGTYSEICSKAKEKGLELCPPETGFILANEYEGDWITIAMEPITGRDGDPRVFGLRRDADGLWVGADFAGPSGRWRAGGEFVFRTRKSFDPLTLSTFVPHAPTIKTVENLLIAYGADSLTLNKGDQHMILTMKDLAFIVESAIRNQQVVIKAVPLTK